LAEIPASPCAPLELPPFPAAPGTIVTPEASWIVLEPSFQDADRRAAGTAAAVPARCAVAAASTGTAAV
jgi:hypothetical protein